jgi:hypothetical protein
VTAAARAIEGIFWPLASQGPTAALYVPPPVSTKTRNSVPSPVEARTPNQAGLRPFGRKNCGLW